MYMVIKRFIIIRKITILKGLIISKLVHKASNLPLCLPDSFMKDLNQVGFKMGKNSKIAIML